MEYHIAFLVFYLILSLCIYFKHMKAIVELCINYVHNILKIVASYFRQLRNDHKWSYNSIGLRNKCDISRCRSEIVPLAPHAREDRIDDRAQFWFRNLTKQKFLRLYSLIYVLSVQSKRVHERILTIHSHIVEWAWGPLINITPSHCYKFCWTMKYLIDEST